MSEENHEDFNNLDNVELQNSDIPCYKTKSFIFILISFLVFIIAVGVFLYFFILKKMIIKMNMKKKMEMKKMNALLMIKINAYHVI